MILRWQRVVTAVTIIMGAFCCEARLLILALPYH